MVCFLNLVSGFTMKPWGLASSGVGKKGWALCQWGPCLLGLPALCRTLSRAAFASLLTPLGIRIPLVQEADVLLLRL